MADTLSSRDATGPAADRHPRKSTVGYGQLWASYLVVPAFILLSWDLSVRYNLLPNTLIATPPEVVQRFARLIMNGKLYHHISVSGGRLIPGFVIGSILGILAGIAVGSSRLASRLIEPTILSILPVPAVAWVPLFIVLFGIGEASKILLIALGSFCTLFLHTAHGIRAADRKLVELAHVLGKSPGSVVRRILVPSAVPEMFAAARLAMALSWALLIVAEVIASSSGLGWLIWDARNFNRPADMIVGMITIGLLGKLSDWVITTVGKTASSWRDVYGQ